MSTALPATAAPGDFRVRFADRIEPELNSGCHLWAGSTSSAGYGTATWDGESRLAHRCAFEDANGVGSADGVVVRHKCDTPPCVNEAHLLGGTHLDNYNDAHARGRLNPVRGERVNTSVLTETDVVAIRAKASAGTPVSVLAAEYDLTHSAMDAAVRGRTWKHLDGAVFEPAKAPIPGAQPGQGGKLTEDEVRAIKIAMRGGARTVDLSLQYGVRPDTISAIRVGRNWSHVD